MLSLFISDLHLHPNQSDLTDLFIYFLKNQVRYADTLYILGDLFDAWIGADHLSSFNKMIISAFLELKKNGVELYFMPGNRDFLINKALSEEMGCLYLRDPSVISLYGIRTLLTHGDWLCTLDKAYQYFRYWSRSAYWQTFFLKLPLELRKKIAFYLRAKNKGQPELSDSIKYDVVMRELFTYLKKYPDIKLVIHGHTHRPCIQLIQHADHFIKRFVLSDWSPERANVLKVTSKQQFRLIYFNKHSTHSIE
jgi:UDP-2,3-diacylglucosamine hydrolase